LQNYWPPRLASQNRIRDPLPSYVTDRSQPARPLRASRGLASRPTIRHLAAALAVVGALAGPAAADPAAEALFKEGRAFMAAGDPVAACDRFERSQRLEPRVGTLANLAECRRLQGQLAASWEAWIAAEALAKQSGDQRQADARAQADALQPLLAQFTIRLPGEPPPGLTITRNGQPIAEAAWNVELPLDPGTYEIRVTAPGFKPWTTRVVLATGARDATTVPALEPDPTAPAPAPAPRLDTGGAAPELTAGAAARGADPPLKHLSFGLAFGGTSDSDIIGGARINAQYPLPYGAARATLQGLYTKLDTDGDVYHHVHLYAVGLGFDYVAPWAKGLASAAGIGVGMDIFDDNYQDHLLTENWFALRASPIIVRLGSPSIELGIHLMYVEPAEVLLGVVAVDWFVR
jgi:hypothetical protein